MPSWLSIDSSTGVLYGTPADGDVGAIDITVTATDSFNASVSDTYTLTVNAANSAPIAVADTATTNEDTFVVIDVLANDTDIDGDELTITSATSDGYTHLYTPSLQMSEKHCILGLAPSLRLLHMLQLPSHLFLCSEHR